MLNIVLIKEERVIDMTDQRIYELACIFKSAMVVARDEGLFNGDYCFDHFPRGCCGDTCYLLATFLQSYGIETLYVWGSRRSQTHAWLVVNDDRVRAPITRYTDVDGEYARLIKQYGEELDGPIKVTRYEARDLTNGLVIDITADQFGEPSVYVGKRNAFYRKFTFCDAHICEGATESRLSNLYRQTSSFLPR